MRVCVYSVFHYPLPLPPHLSLSLSLSLDDRVCERVMSSRELSEYPGHEGDETTRHKVSRKKRGGGVCVCVCVCLCRGGMGVKWEREY